MADVKFTEIETAWWAWIKAGCPDKSTKTQVKWGNSNVFGFDGTEWTRFHGRMLSNSGKTSYPTETTFTGKDGRVVELVNGRSVNRRNDSNRNFGLHE